ncbi:MAG TPA: hypothetical protein PKA28_07780 [Methylomusa anaerophila]|uniref:Lipoprotein n=1 Tax=Methylomusa anaerophila TaxID=1930071 RepID=A0A348AFU4_9FIRM|nr:hypothetical protein [Methylomusa anaerophila]BBB89942.1 hypothetical protein MAMMFC1_00582 [Methylomusa anaerophila]HML88331.1 hypothetical protein [Methylomusa anaerophila]
MKRLITVLMIVCQCLFLIVTGCTGESGERTERKAASAQLQNEPRISFDIEDKSTGTYKQHICQLWEKTKMIIKEDAGKDLTDEQYLFLGKEVRRAWLNLHAHSCLYHQENISRGIEDTPDHKLETMIGHVLGLIDELYGWPTDEKESREDARKRLIQSDINGTIRALDNWLQSADMR